MVLARVQPRHQVTLPKELRHDLGVEAGDTLMFYKVDGEWHVRRKPESLLALMDEIRAESAGITTLEDVRRWRDDPEP